MDLGISFLRGRQRRKEGARLPTASGTLLVLPLGAKKGVLLNG